MGAGASTLGPSGPPVGKFQLSEEQRKQNDVLSNLFLALLQNNNLLDLSKLVSRSDTECKQLIITLSSQLEKEFQSLRFPDPTRTRPDVTASFMAQDRYTLLSSKPGDQARKDVCRFIALFLLRFVLLVASLVSSISITDTIPTLSRTAMVPALKSIEDSISVKPFIEMITYDKFIKSNLIPTRFAIPLESDPYLFILDSSYYLDLTGGFLYKKTDTGERVKVVGVEMGYKPFQRSSTQQYGQPARRQMLSQFTPQEEYERQLTDVERERDRLKRQLQSDRPDYRYDPYYRPPPDRSSNLQRRLEELERRTARAESDTLTARPETVRNTRSDRSNLSTGSTPSVSTLRTDVYRREGDIRPESESAEDKEKSFILMMRLYDVAKCVTFNESCLTTPGALLSEFYIDDYGRTYDVTTFEQSRGRIEPQFSIPFSSKVEDALSRSTKEAIVGERESRKEKTQEVSKEVKDFQLHQKTIEFLKTLELKGTSIVAPSALRAYLLATEAYSSMEDGKTVQRLKYSFCMDPWQKTLLDDITAYSLFASLFNEYDSRDGRIVRPMQSNSAFEEFKTKMQNEQILEADTSKDSIWRAKFKPVPANIACSQKDDYLVISPENKPRIQLLQASYTKLRGIYDKHLRAVIEFIKTILVVDETFLKAMARPGRYLEEALADPVLRLHPVFINNPNGSFEVLQERTNAARKLLGDHYLEVEKLYKDTLVQLDALTSGTSTVIKKGGRRTRRQRSTRGRKTRRS